MRRTESEVKNELLRRRNQYILGRKQLTKRIISAVVCVALLLAPVVTVLLLPSNDGKRPTDTVSIVFDSSKPQHNNSTSEQSVGTVSKDDVSEVYSNAGSSGTPETSDEQTTPEPDISESLEDLSAIIQGGLASSQDSSSTDDNTEISDGSAETSEEIFVSEDTSYDEDSSDASQDASSYLPPDDLNMIYPPMPDDGKSLDLFKVLTVDGCGVSGKPVNNAFASALTSFGVELFKQTAKNNDNTLISPLSLMLALSMAANGAWGETREEMQNALGGFDIETLNKQLYSYVKDLPSTKNSCLSVKNSLWIKDGFGVNSYFLKDCLNYYGADAFMSPFTSQTKDEVNAWIEENTGGMIKEMIKELDSNAVMLLVNALSFEAKWQKEFVVKADREKQKFTNENGTKTDVYYLYGGYEYDEYDTNPDVKYIENNLATGFVKNYKDGYAFVALLPKDENGIDNLVNSITGAGIMSVLGNSRVANLHYSIPQFSFSCSVSSSALKQALTDMGMVSAFDYNTADFSNINASDLYIDSIFNNTVIEVNSAGTKAAAATVIIPAPGSPPVEDATIPTEQVYLDRSFVYLIIETETNTPVFMGKVTDISKSLPTLAYEQ